MQQSIVGHIDRLVGACCVHRDSQSKDRETAQEYYRGEMKDLPVTRAGRSRVVSQDVRATITKIMPSIMRAVLGSETVVQYEPVGEGDETAAEQATDYVNHVVIPECGAASAIHDAIFDAALIKTGILKWSAYKTREVTIQEYTDQSDDAVLGLFDDPDIEIIGHEKTDETDPDILDGNPSAKRHSFKLKQVEEKTDIRLEAIPRGSFLISPGANSIGEAELVGEELVVTRSQLVEWGYNREKVLSLASHSGEEAEEESRKGEDYSEEDAETLKALEEVQIYEVYVRVDTDDDGIAEMHRVVYGEGAGKDRKDGQILLAHEQVSEVPYADVVVERDPHQFEGHSFYEDIRDIQRVKTAVLRGVMDNVYATNNPKPFVQGKAVENPDALVSGAWTEAVLLKDGMRAKDAIEWGTVPFFAGQLFPVLEYFDGVAKDRTGITDASGGLDPEAFQNTSATAAHLMSESGIAQADAIVKSVSRGLQKAFRGLLKLVIAHADSAASVKMRGEWVEYDPRTWDVNMNATVNVGLGGGTKERDLAILQVILGLQKEIMAAFGPGNPVVTPEKLYHTLKKITETAGFASADPFFTAPDPDQIARQSQEAEAKAAAKVEEDREAEFQHEARLKGIDVQAQRDKEDAQMQADITVKKADLEIRERENEAKFALEREKIASQERLALAKIEADLNKADLGGLKDYFAGGLT